MARPVVMIVFCLGSLLEVSVARGEAISSGMWRLSGDFRTRIESDFDSEQADGTARDDRLRLRIRARLALDLQPSERFSLGLRLRSGSENSQQSPHITLIDFDDNDTGEADFTFDRWRVRGSWERGWVSAGRDSLPFWTRNELVWDDDVTVAGVAGGVSTELAGGQLELLAGLHSLPVGMRDFAGELTGVQLVYERPAQRTLLKTAAGWLHIDASSADPDASRLLSGNGLRDYSILVGSLELGLATRGRTLTAGVDFLHNTENYASTDPDPVTAANFDQTDGLVLSLAWGSLGERGDWLAAWTFAHIEKLATNASYAQDDWIRWGSSNETRASDFEGHELRFAYRLLADLDLVSRLYLVESTTTVEDGRRLRIDLNWRF